MPADNHIMPPQLKHHPYYNTYKMRQQGPAMRKNFTTKLVVFAMTFLSLSLSHIVHATSINNRKISPLQTSSSSSSLSYVVIFDAGSSGSRIHVYHFSENLDLLPMGDGIEVYEKIKPGLSAYDDDPKKAAASLIPLLDKAEMVIPIEFHPTTPVRLGATAGLRLLKGDTAERILEEVREVLKTKSTFKYQPNAVTILSGSQEGSYLWVATNYLLGNLGKEYSKTVGVVDLGGGSVQMAYAISKEAAEKAPKLQDNEDSYIQNFYFKGTTYYLYVHSYLSYGTFAARALILKVTENSSNPCILAGYQGTYEYNGKKYKASSSPLGSSLRNCRRVILEALKVKKPCNYSRCSFNGVWNGGGGDGLNNLYLASSFYGVAAHADFIDRNKPEAKVRAIDIKKAADRACRTKYVDSKTAFPNFWPNDVQFVCMDLVYQYTLLVDGFGVQPRKEITMVQKIKYHDSHLVDISWPLGNALASISSSLSYLKARAGSFFNLS